MAAAAVEAVDVSSLSRHLSVAEVRELVDKGQVSCVELAREYVRRIRTGDARSKAVVELRSLASILRDAEAAGGPSGAGGALRCVPTVVKDNMDVRGMVTTAGSAALQESRAKATRDAPSVAALKDAGAVILGHANMDEFACKLRSCFSPFNSIHIHIKCYKACEGRRPLS